MRTMKPLLCNGLIAVSCLFFVEATGAGLSAKQKAEEIKGGSAKSVIQSNEKPDIVIRNMNIDGGTAQGGKLTLHAENAVSIVNGKCYFDMFYALENTGNVKTTPFRYVLKLNNKKVNGHNNIVLGKGESESYYYKVGLKSGLNKIKLKADKGNKVLESNEKNNKLAKKLLVLGDCSNANDELTLDIEKPVGKGTKTKSSGRANDYSNGVPIEDAIKLKQKQ